MSSLGSIGVEYRPSQPFAEFRAQHDAALPLWQADQPVPSLHRSVAELHIDPDMLAIIEGDIRKLGKQIVDMQAISGTGFLTDIPHKDRPLFSSRLVTFLETSMQLFKEIIEHDIGQKDDSLTFGSFIGPYEARPGDSRWHRDFDDPGAVTYIMPLLGRPTLFGLDDLASSDFERDALKPDRYPTTARTTDYGPLVVTAHNSTYTAHRGPGPEHNGHPRILFNCFADGLLLHR